MNKSIKNKYLNGNIKDFRDSKGWFVGHFMRERGYPLLESSEVEVAYKTL